MPRDGVSAKVSRSTSTSFRTRLLLAHNILSDYSRRREVTQAGRSPVMSRFDICSDRRRRLTTIAMVEATSERDGKTTISRRYYLSSAKPSSRARKNHGPEKLVICRKRSGWSDAFARSILGQNAIDLRAVTL